MSRFLAPIHSWLFNKINLYQALENAIVDIHVDKFGQQANDIQKEAIERFGQQISSKPLEEQIDTNNIHGWLQERIKEVETRQCFIVKTFKEVFGDASVNLVKSEYVLQAQKCASETAKYNSPEEVYSSLNDFILAGMPCDRVNSIKEKNDCFILYNEKKSVTTKNFKLVDCDVQYMIDLRILWISSYVSSLPTKYEFIVETNEEETINRIVKG